MAKSEIKKSKYPQFILNVAQLQEILVKKPEINIVLCVQGLGRSPKEAKLLTDSNFPAFALANGLLGIKETAGDNSLVLSVIAQALNVIATINPAERREYGPIINKINRSRVRNVIVSENHQEILEKVKSFQAPNSQQPNLN